jgi:hypothetical protein
MSLFNKFCHTAHCSCKQSQHRPLKVVLEIYDFFGVGHKCCKIGPQLFPTTLHLVIYISNLCFGLVLPSGGWQSLIGTDVNISWSFERKMAAIKGEFEKHCNYGKAHFKLVIYYRGHHWKGVKISTRVSYNTVRKVPIKRSFFKWPNAFSIF